MEKKRKETKQEKTNTSQHKTPQNKRQDKTTINKNSGETDWLLQEAIVVVTNK